MQLINLNRNNFIVDQLILTKINTIKDCMFSNHFDFINFQNDSFRSSKVIADRTEESLFKKKKLGAKNHISLFVMLDSHIWYQSTRFNERKRRILKQFAYL